MAEETAPATKPCTACKRRDGTHAPSCYKSKAKGGQRRGKSPPAPPAMATVAAWLDEQIDSLKGELAYMERLKARV